ncbi:uncharacterized protein LOC125177717 [Hyalella azteca]|uniref:Uncharacterized protein LOC125177717 n=1 Tax=Hyalella azteca TaxID=294128 RepID=A0A979FH76_HYAAZ|nr:uncharacterized protein LOC125177717 [Hyalella azteca]
MAEPGCCCSLLLERLRCLVQPRRPLEPLREVLLYVVPALSRDSPSHLTRRWPQLKKAFRDACLNGDEVKSCVARCRPDHAEIVAELAALTPEYEKWNVMIGRHVAAVAAMLNHAKPSCVVIATDAAALRGAPWGALVAAAEGVEVWMALRSNDKYGPYDDLLLPLHDSG